MHSMDALNMNVFLSVLKDVLPNKERPINYLFGGGGRFNFLYCLNHDIISQKLYFKISFAAFLASKCFFLQNSFR